MTRRRVFTPSCAPAACVPDIVTDQTAAHDPLVGYVPDGLSLDDAAELRARDPEAYVERGAGRRWPATARRWSSCRTLGATVFDYGNNLRTEAKTGRLRARLRLPRLRARVRAAAVLPRHRALPLGGAVSGDPDDIAATDAAMRELFPENVRLQRWLDQARSSASPSRACPRASAGSATATGTAPGLRFNELVRSGEVTAPLVIGRDHLDSGLGRVAVPRDRGDARRLRRDRRLAAS